jgi:hypothetical protein
VVVVAGTPEDLALDVVDVLVDVGDGLLVAVHDQIRGPVEHPRRAVGQQRGVAAVRF